MMKLNLRVHDGCPSGHRAFHSGTSSVIMPPSTGPLDALRDKHGLVLVDVANLFCGATRAGCELSFEMLASLLRASLRVADLHAFFARNTRNPGLENSFRASGYRAHQRDVEYVATVKGKKVWLARVTATTISCSLRVQW